MTPVSYPLIHFEIRGWIDNVNSLDVRLLTLPEQLANVHWRFEQIHPFLDGNGRTGRLILNLIPVRLGGLYTWVDTSWLAALSHPSGALLNMPLVRTLRFPAKCSPGAHRRLSEVFFMCAVLYNAALESGGAHSRGGGSTTPESLCLQS